VLELEKGANIVILRVRLMMSMNVRLNISGEKTRVDFA